MKSSDSDRVTSSMLEKLSIDDRRRSAPGRGDPFCPLISRCGMRFLAADDGGGSEERFKAAKVVARLSGLMFGSAIAENIRTRPWLKCTGNEKAAGMTW